MARRKRKDEPTDWVAPDFDEVGYMRTEIQAAKTAVLTIAWAAVGAIVSFLLYSVNAALAFFAGIAVAVDRKCTRLNSSHVKISYAVFCMNKNKGARLW